MLDASPLPPPTPNRGNVGGVDATGVQYIGLQGDHSHDKRQAVEATYELNCVHRDTFVKVTKGASEGI